MVDAILAPLRLTGGNSIVLYQSILPERYSITLPFIEAADEEKIASFHESQLADQVLYYDHRGHLRRQTEKGLLIDVFF